MYGDEVPEGAKQDALREIDSFMEEEEEEVGEQLLVNTDYFEETLLWTLSQHCIPSYMLNITHKYYKVIYNKYLLLSCLSMIIVELNVEEET